MKAGRVQIPSQFLPLLPSSNQRTLTDPHHGGNLPIGFALFQKVQSQGDLLRRELLGSAVFEVGILSGYGLACLGALHDHSTLVFCERKHNRQNQVTRQGVLDQTHVQDVNPDAPVEQFPDGLDAFDGSSGEAVKLTDHQRIPFLKDFQKPQELGAFHCLARERFLYDLLATVLLQCGHLILQAVAVPPLGGGGHSRISINHGFFLLFYDTKF